MAAVHVFGSINTDLVVYLPRLPRPGETVSGGTFAVSPGGKGANCAVAAARAGARVSLWGCVGRDSYGEERKRSLEHEGIDSSGVVVHPDLPSGIAQIWVDGRGENTIAVAPGANTGFTPAHVRLDGVEPGAVAALQNEIPQATTEALIRALHARGCRTLWNVAPECHARPAPETLAAVDYLIFNENEIRVFAKLAGVDTPGGSTGDVLGAEHATGLAAALCARGARAVIVTLGLAGSILVGPGGTHRQPAFPVRAVDTVGAGDCFCGVLAASLAAGLDAESSMERAAAAAAVSVSRKGAQTSMPRVSEIDRMLATRPT